MNSMTTQALCPEEKSNCSFKLCCQEQYLEVEERLLVHCKMWFTWKKKNKKITTQNVSGNDSAIRDHGQWMSPVTVHHCCLLSANINNPHQTKLNTHSHISGLSVAAPLQTYHERPQHKDILRKWKRIVIQKSSFFSDNKASSLIDWHTFSKDYNFLSSSIHMPSGTNNVKPLDFLFPWYQWWLIVCPFHTFLSGCEWHYNLEDCRESNSVCFE